MDLARLRLRSADVRDRARGRADRLVPPRALRRARHSDVQEAGEALAAALVEHAALGADSRVLDAGCGSAATARALTRVLGEHGRYDGFEADPELIGWARRAFRRHRGFHFVVADVHGRHNPGGAHLPGDYRFPYADRTFDVVLLTLAHGLPDAAEHMLGEAARVLRAGGRLVATYFALNDTSRFLMAEGRSGLVFQDAEESVALLDEAVPDEAVAHDEEWLFKRLREHGLVLTQTHPGSWCGREEFMGFQDLLVAVRDA